MQKSCITCSLSTFQNGRDITCPNPCEINKYKYWEPVAQKDITQPNDTQNMIMTICLELAEFLVEKNKAYGDSAINPVRIFAKSDALEQINVRIDDKINRILQGSGYPGDDDEKDLVGYFILKWVKKRLAGNDAW